MSNTKHFAKGSAKPEIDDDEKLLLYSMRFCPYAARAHLVLDAKKLSYKTVNINLVDKPEWLIEANPLGKVPCLQLRDKPNQPFIIESLLIAEYLDDIYPTPKLYPEDPLERVQEKIWIERFSPITSKFYQALTITDSDELLRIWSEMERLLDAFESELQRRGTKYFGGNEKANILDYAIWPWFQLMELVPKLFGAECDFSGERFPLLKKWFHSLNENDQACQKFRISSDAYLKYIESRRKTGVPDYDLLVKD